MKVHSAVSSVGVEEPMGAPSRNLQIQAAGCYNLSPATGEVQNQKCFRCLLGHNPAEESNNINQLIGLTHPSPVFKQFLYTRT
ncbi:hypothetical protein C1H46_011910 [Malus baccata]|uniref:Uncharacterized protein n=1 Tax=Malus baccata TaxID=106549 RepID=A0A540MUQ9_MALBA|nr:hypothetical protein C1H46_011910 [Malus baccata]